MVPWAPQDHPNPALTPPQASLGCQGGLLWTPLARWAQNPGGRTEFWGAGHSGPSIGLLGVHGSCFPEALCACRSPSCSDFPRLRAAHPSLRHTCGHSLPHVPAPGPVAPQGDSAHSHDEDDDHVVVQHRLLGCIQRCPHRPAESLPRRTPGAPVGVAYLAPCLPEEPGPACAWSWEPGAGEALAPCPDPSLLTPRKVALLGQASLRAGDEPCRWEHRPHTQVECNVCTPSGGAWAEAWQLPALPTGRVGSGYLPQTAKGLAEPDCSQVTVLKLPRSSPNSPKMNRVTGQTGPCVCVGARPGTVRGELPGAQEALAMRNLWDRGLLMCTALWTHRLLKPGSDWWGEPYLENVQHVPVAEQGHRNANLIILRLVASWGDLRGQGNCLAHQGHQGGATVSDSTAHKSQPSLRGQKSPTPVGSLGDRQGGSTAGGQACRLSPSFWGGKAPLPSQTWGWVAPVSPGRPGERLAHGPCPLLR